VAVAVTGGSLAAAGAAQAQAKDDGGIGPGTYVGPGGKQLVIDPRPDLPPRPQSRGLAPQPNAAADGLDAFALHSLPGAQRTIYLDFDGASVTGTAWNDNDALGTGAVVDAAPFDADGDPASFGAAERATIRSIWERVSQDFAPFEVDVTTEEPAPEALTRASLDDETYGVTVVLTDGPAIADTCGCGGLAWVDVFDAVGDAHDHFQPAFVFTPGVGHEAKYVAEAVSHEAGHNLGLVHDSTSSATYYRGHGAWAPIMGDGYYRPVVQWSRGEYVDARNNGTIVLQDDVAEMAGNGIPLRPDDHGGSAPTATPLAGPGPWTAHGLISTAADQDWFRIDVPAAGAVTVHVAPSAVSGGRGVSPNLDVRLSIRSAAGEVVFDDPTSSQIDNDHAAGLDATITRNLAAGTWYLVVDGVGALDPATTGYSDYGSLGTYALDAAFDPGIPPGRVAGDLTGDGSADEGVYRPSAKAWYLNGSPPHVQSTLLPGGYPVMGQWDADPEEDFALVNPLLGLWQVEGQAPVIFGLGLLGDQPVPADWDGDGDLDIAAFRPLTGQWLVRGGPTTSFGKSGDIPVPGQWDSDPQADIAVYRPSTGEWLVKGQGTRTLGQAGDLPVPVDTDGDGVLEPAVWRAAEGRWIVLGGPDVVVGQPGDVPVSGQWDRAAGDELGVYRPSTGTWITPAGSVAIGQRGDLPVRVRPQILARIPL
jgi:hypothetical protein